MAKNNVGATLSLKNGNFFANVKSAISASGKLKNSLSGATSGVKKFSTQTSSAGSVLTSVAKKAAAAAGAFISIKAAINLGKDIVEIGSAYQDSVAKVSTIADTTAKSIKQLSAETIALSNTTGVAASDLNEALYQAISAGADTAHATELVSVAVKAAKGGFTDTATAVDGLTSVLNTYNMETTHAHSLANKFLITQNKGKTSFGELATTIGQVAPVAKSSSVGISELLSSVASLTANGLSTSSAMTGLKAALSNIIKPTSDAQKTAKALGLDFSTAAIKAQGFSGFMKTLKEKTGGNTGTMAKLFGSVEGLNSMLTLTSDGGMKLMSDTMAQMQTNTTALDDAYSAMTNTVSAQSDILKNKLSNMKINIFEKLDGSKFVDVVKMCSSGIDRLTPVAERVTVAIGNGLFNAIQSVASVARTVFSAVKTAVENNRPAIENLKSAFENVKTSIANAFSGNGTAVIQTLADVIIPNLCNSLSLVMNIASTAIPVISALSPAIAGVAGAVTAYKIAASAANAVESIRNGLIAFSAVMTGTQAAALAPLTTATIAQIAATQAWVVAQKALKAAMTFATSGIGPWIIAIGVVIAAGVWLYKHWDSVKKWAKKLWDGIKDVFGGIKNTISNAWDKVKENTSTVWDALKDTVSEKLSNIKSAYEEHGGGIKGAAFAVMEGVKGYYTAGYDFVDKLTGGKLGKVVEGVKSKLAPMVGTVKEKLSGIKDAFGNAFGNAVNFVKNSYNDGALKPVVDKITGAFNNVKTAIVEKFGGNKEAIVSKLALAAKVAVTIKGKLAEGFNGVKSAIAERFNGIKETVSSVLSPLTGAAADVLNGIKSVFSSIGDYIKNTAANIKNSVISVVNGIKQNFAGFFNSLKAAFDKVKSGVSGVFNGIKTIASGALRFIVGIFTLNTETIKGAIGKIKEGFSSAFEGAKQIVLGVWTAVTSAATLAFENVKTVVGGAITAVKTQFTTIKNTVSGVFSSVFSTVSTTFDKVKTKITSVFDKVKSVVSKAVDGIKKCFNFKWELPKIKLPHFKIEGSFSLHPPSVPKLGIDWYANGGIMNRPTVFGFNGNRAMVGGEAGSEAILPLAPFWQRLDSIMKKQPSESKVVNNYVTVKVYSENKNDDELANIVARKIVELLDNI